MRARLLLSAVPDKTLSEECAIKLSEERASAPPLPTATCIIIA
eukprot:COSAG06_NODE_50708_length_316_cov_7.027650_2_plen_42_part_01